MLDIKFVRENPELVKQNIKNKFQDDKLPLVDEVIALDLRNREIKQEVEALRAARNKASKEIGKLMGQGKKDEAEAVKAEVAKDGDRIDELTAEEKQGEEQGWGGGGSRKRDQRQRKGAGESEKGPYI